MIGVVSFGFKKPQLNSYQLAFKYLFIYLFIYIGSIMTLMFTVVSWHPVPLVKLVTGPRATTVNMIYGYFLNSQRGDRFLFINCLLL